MTKDELLKLLRSLPPDGDAEGEHSMADRALIEYIDDPEIAAAYEAVPKWYA